MCSRYRSTDADLFYQLQEIGGLEMPKGEEKDIRPGCRGSFIRRSREAEAGADEEPTSRREVLTGVFGLLPSWAQDETLALSNYNASAESVAADLNYRDAWGDGQHCIVPAACFYGTDWRTGEPRPARVAMADGRPMGLAALWDRWKNPAGEIVYSYSLLTVNGEGHALMSNFFKPGEAVRMVVILPEAQYSAWLDASPKRSRSFLQQYPAELLVTTAEGAESS